MSDFAQNFIQGVQAGQARAKAQKDYEIAAEERDLKKQMLKHQMDRLKIEDQLHARELQVKEAGIPQMGVPTDTAGLAGSPIMGPPNPDPVARGEARDVALTAVDGMVPASSIRVPTIQGTKIDLQEAFDRKAAADEARSKVWVPANDPSGLPPGPIDKEIYTAVVQGKNLDSRLEFQGEQTDKRIAASERNTAAQIAAADRRAALSRGTGVAGLGELPSSDQDAIKELARRVTEGEMTVSDARGLLGGVHGGKGKAFTEALLATGSRVAPPKVREGLQDLKRTQNLVTEIRTLVDEIASSTNPEDKLKKAVLLENFTMSVGTMLARGFGERGVVTDADRNAAIGLVPGWKSSNFAPQFAQDKLAILDKMIERNSDALTKGYFERIPSKGGVPPTAATASPFKIIEIK